MTQNVYVHLSLPFSAVYASSLNTRFYFVAVVFHFYPITRIRFFLHGYLTWFCRWSWRWRASCSTRRTSWSRQAPRRPCRGSLWAATTTSSPRTTSPNATSWRCVSCDGVRSTQSELPIYTAAAKRVAQFRGCLRLNAVEVSHFSLQTSVSTGKKTIARRRYFSFFFTDPRTDHDLDDRFPLHDVDIWRIWRIWSQIYSPSCMISCCRVGNKYIVIVICTIHCSTCFRGWIWTMQVLHNLSQRQVRK